MRLSHRSNLGLLLSVMLLVLVPATASAAPTSVRTIVPPSRAQVRKAMRAAQRLRQMPDQQPAIRLALSGRKIAMRSAVRGLIRRYAKTGSAATLAFEGGTASFVEVERMVQVRFELPGRSALLVVNPTGDGRVTVSMHETMNTGAGNTYVKAGAEYADSEARLAAIEYLPPAALARLLPRIHTVIHENNWDEPLVEGDVTVTRTGTGLQIDRVFTTARPEHALAVAQNVIAGYVGAAATSRDRRGARALARVYAHARPWLLRTVTAAEGRIPVRLGGSGKTVAWTRGAGSYVEGDLEIRTSSKGGRARAEIYRAGQLSWRMTVTRSAAGVETVKVEGYLRVERAPFAPADFIALLAPMPYLAAAEHGAVAVELPLAPVGGTPNRISETVAPLQVSLESAAGDARTWKIEKTLRGENVANRLLRAEFLP